MLARSSRTAWGFDDPVSSVLLDLRLEGTFFCRSDLGAPWVMNVPPRDCAAFHFVADGPCWLELPGARPRRLDAGDLVLVPRGPAHRLSDNQRMHGRLVDDTSEAPLGHRVTLLRDGDGSRRSQLVCGGVVLEGPVSSSLEALLPDLIVLQQSRSVSPVSTLLEAMQAEADAVQPGGATVMTRLADVIVVHALRAWLADAPGADLGWLRALRDPQLGPPIAAIHRQPEVDWSLDSLAALAHASRSVFARRFADVVGVTPKRYTTRVRMHRARELLRNEALTVAEVAARFGYESEAAFSRAFKRVIGVSPGAVRLPRGR
jgi:AraC-like DNA-binding protein